jgi:hypothetical protein
MSNRPIKKEHQRYERIAGKCYTIGWNACIDAYEQWEKENPRLERLDYEKVKNFLYANADGIYTMDNATDVSKNICQAFGQPKDAVSVEEIEKVAENFQQVEWIMINDLSDNDEKIMLRRKNFAKKIHALINRKLKGQIC